MRHTTMTRWLPSRSGETECETAQDAGVNESLLNTQRQTTPNQSVEHLLRSDEITPGDQQ
jgi:hypothetical protein